MGDVAGRIVADADATLDALLGRTDAHRDAELGDAYHDRRVADVLTHLHAWHLLFEGWLTQDRSGAVPAFPAEGYTWETLDALNDALYRAHRHRTYDQARDLLVDSHRRALALVRECGDRALTAIGEFAWLGTESLAEVAHECLGGHYRWALGVLDRAGVPAA